MNPPTQRPRQDRQNSRAKCFRAAPFNEINNLRKSHTPHTSHTSHFAGSAAPAPKQIPQPLRLWDRDGRAVRGDDPEESGETNSWKIRP